MSKKPISPQSAADLETIFNNVHVLLAYLNRNFNFIRVNRAYAEADERDPDFFPGKNHFELYPDTENQALFHRAVDTGQPVHIFEKPFFNLNDPERRVIYCDWSLNPIIDETGNVTTLTLMLVDVTERVRNRKELTATSNHSHMMVEASPDPMASIDLDGVIRYANHATETVYGYKPEEVINHSYLDFVDDPAKARDGFERVVAEGSVRDFRLEFRRRNGDLIPILFNGSLYKDPNTGEARILTTARDISRLVAAQSERDRANVELQQRIDELHRKTAVMERAEQLARFGYWQADFKAEQEWWSDQLFKLMGFQPQAFTPKLLQFFDHVHPHDLERMKELADRHIAESRDFDTEVRIVWPDGEEHTLHVYGEIEAGVDGNATWIFGVAHDVTALKRMEWFLRERFRVMAENLDDVVWISTPNNQKIVYVNSNYERIWGRSSRELYERAEVFFETIHPDDRERVKAGMKKHHGSEWKSEYRILRPDGSIRYIRDRGFPLIDERREWNLIIGISSDVTESRRAEQKLERKTRDLEHINAELEEFAYVASHDLKAPLRAVANLAYWIEEDVAERLDEENRNRIHLLRSRIFRMDRLIDGLLTYARLGRNQGVAQEPVSLQNILDEVITEIAIPSGFRIEIEKPLPLLQAHPIDLRQIFQNLISNAFQHHDRSEGTVWVRTRDIGDYWELAVADDGPGIPKEAKHSIFRMFSRLTGEKGEGAGIGLALVKKLVLSHGGEVDVVDNMPRGSVFLIKWPK